MKHLLSRRHFMAAGSAATVAALAPVAASVRGRQNAGAGPLAILGGPPVRKKKWPAWPIWDRTAEPSILAVLRSGNWFRGQGKLVSEFEKRYAELVGAKRCLATASGTTALITALHVLGVDAGDEVIVSPYTFIATYNAVLARRALPVFADTDQETFTINPAKIEERITERTRALLPVHILGLPVDMDGIMAIAKKHQLVVIEDACQAWLAEYKNKQCGTIGDLGCYSFQNSKHLPAGEGGAVVGNDEELLNRCSAYHNCGRAMGTYSLSTGYATHGLNYRMQEFQAVILMSQMKRMQNDATLRNQNAEYLASRLKQIPGIIPYKLNEGVTRAAFHLFPFRYKQEAFNEVPRKKFIAALEAEGVPCSSGYGPQYRDGLLDEAIQSKSYQRLFPPERLKRYREELVLPENDQLCNEAVWFYQSMLLATRQDMDDIADAVQKIYENRDKLA